MSEKYCEHCGLADDITERCTIAEDKARDLQLRISELEKENERLTKERTTYRTLDALLGDNGQMCELHDDIEALEAKIATLELSVESCRTLLSEAIQMKESWKILKPDAWTKNEQRWLDEAKIALGEKE